MPPLHIVVAHVCTPPPPYWQDGMITLEEFDANLHPKTRAKLEAKLDEGFNFDPAKWAASAPAVAPAEAPTADGAAEPAPVPAPAEADGELPSSPDALGKPPEAELPSAPEGMAKPPAE